MSNSDYEKPVHRVAISKPLAVGKFELTFAEWDACVSAGGCQHSPEDPGWGRGKHLVVNVSWDDATKEYLPWLSRTTARTYRLLTQAEWEYAARAGSGAQYTWGDDIGKNRANCDGCGSQWDKRQTALVGSFAANAFGLHDLHGNVWEWTEDCWHRNYHGAPTDGSAWIIACDSGRVARGGSWDFYPYYLGSGIRYGYFANFRGSAVGFRLARTLSP